MASASAQLLRGVRVAWPTILLFIVAVSAWTASSVAMVTGWLPAPIAVVINAVAAYAAFTPMHDAAHKAIARAGWVNELIGRAAALLLMAPFPALRYLHLEHHKHTNDPDDDPDFYSGRGAWWSLPLRWLSQDLHYYWRYVGELRSRPKAESRETLAVLAVLWLLAIAVSASGFAYEVVLLWLLPARVAIGVLAFSFDYLPHRPHVVSAKENRYAATLIFRERWLTPLLLFQNYHLVHHLFPGVPFYRYGKVWFAKRRELVEKGANEVSVFAPKSSSKVPLPERVRAG